MKPAEIIIHTDGGARGNPGPAAGAFVAEINGEVLGYGAKYLGTTTNNVAEYQAVLLALEWLLKSEHLNLTDIKIIFYLDSELIVKQINGIYKVKNETLKKINSEVKKIIEENKIKSSFISVPRSENKKADLLVNKELDKHFS